MATRSFAVTFDYRCPFARNIHEHILDGLAGGADWDVDFRPFSLSQVHVEEGEPSVFDDERAADELLALEAAVVVRARWPEAFPAVHRALFAARHDHARDIRDKDVVLSAVREAGVDDADAVLTEIAAGWPRQAVRDSHEQAVSTHRVFGVPTFIVGDTAVFVRVMTRPQGDRANAIATIERVLDLIENHAELNEFKHTTISR
jgi:protein-disulfide isomerase-like protein with CxxC motif